MIAERVDKWEYSGGHVGHLWKDSNDFSEKEKIAFTKGSSDLKR